MLALRSRVGTRPSRVLLGGSLFVSPAAYFICKPVLRADEGGGRPALLAPPREEAFCARRSAAPSALGDHRLPFASRAGLFPPPLPPLSRLRARRQGISTTERSHCSIASPNPFSRFFFVVFGKIVVPETHNQGGREGSKHITSS